MDTDDIQRALRGIKNFDGVYSIHTLPTRPRLLVCYNGSPYKPGRHWICICVENETGEYFDSLGLPPNQTLHRYMCAVCNHWTFNWRQLKNVVSTT